MGRMAGLLIGELAQRAGVTAPTIRYYEEIGLLPRPVRTASGYRRYADSAVEELRFIRKAQTLGFSLDEIGGILDLSRSGRTPCSHVLSLAQQHLDALDQRIGQLQRFRDHLASGLAKWRAENTAVTCRGLCQWIAETEPDAAADVPTSLKPTRAGAR